MSAMAFLGVRDEEMTAPIFLDDAINLVVPPPAMRFRDGDPLLEAYVELRRIAWHALLSNLKTGSIASFLQIPATGRCVRIPRAYWIQGGHDDIMPEQFDQLPDAYGWEPSMAGAPIIVRTTDITQWNASLPVVDAPPSTPAKAPVVSTSGAKIRGRNWLQAKFDDPGTLTMAKDDLADLAVEEVSGLSRRSFDQVWRELSRNYPARTRRGPKPKA
jgi:hypothetical protein